MKKGIAFVLALAFLSLFNFSVAAVVVQRTRVVIEPGEREGSVVVSALKSSASLMQVWLAADHEADTEHFTVTPALSLVKAGASQGIRVIYQGKGAATDRETLLRLNIQDAAPTTPSLEGQNNVSSTLLQVLKVFYRPESLRGQDALGAPLKIKWTMKEKKGSDYVVALENPGPFHIVFAGLALLGNDGKESKLIASDADFQVLKPMSSAEIVLRASGLEAPVQKLVFSTVDDFGMTEVFTGDVVGDDVLRVERVVVSKDRQPASGDSDSGKTVPSAPAIPTPLPARPSGRGQPAHSAVG